MQILIFLLTKDTFKSWAFPQLLAIADRENSRLGLDNSIVVVCISRFLISCTDCRIRTLLTIGTVVDLPIDGCFNHGVVCGRRVLSDAIFHMLGIVLV